MSAELYAAFLAACVVLVLVPGPTVTLTLANSLKHGTRAGLLSVLGTQLGLAVMLVIVGVGLTSLVEAAGHWFDWLRLAGAAYLVWLGWKMIRGAGQGLANGTAAPPRGGFVLQGALVALSNPKTLLFFGAFFPQFVDPARNFGLQILIMGVTAMAVAVVSDSLYALAAGRARRAFTAKRVAFLERISGGFLIGGGLWLAFSRSRWAMVKATARVTGIGGVFFRARDPRALAAWYERHLGIDDIQKSVWTQEAGSTVFAPFAHDTDYFGRTEQQWMINFRVDDLDGLMASLKREGIAVETRAEWDSEVGRFCRIHDPEGNPIELWEPAKAPRA